MDNKNNKATPKVMRLVKNNYRGLMECKVCGARHYAMVKHGGGFVRGSWQCPRGCRLPEKNG